MLVERGGYGEEQKQIWPISYGHIQVGPSIPRFRSVDRSGPHAAGRIGLFSSRNKPSRGHTKLWMLTLVLLNPLPFKPAENRRPCLAPKEILYPGTKIGTTTTPKLRIIVFDLLFVFRPLRAV